MNDTDVFTFDGSAKTLITYTKVYAKKGTYTFTLKASLVDYPLVARAQMDFSIKVDTKCDLGISASVKAALPLLEYKLTYSEATLDASDAFAVTPSYCPIKYTFTANSVLTLD